MKKVDFETALKEIEKVITTLQDGELSIDESIDAYKKGLELCAICDGHISKAKLTIEELSND